MRARLTPLALGLAALTCVTAAPALAAQPVTLPDGRTVEPGYTRLSDEKKLSRWAYTNLIAKVRSEPRSSARVVGKLRWQTEDHRPELYLALQEYISPGADDWIQVRLPKRPNGTTGWVPRDALADFHVVRTQLVINRRKHRIALFKRGRKIFSAPVGVGRPSLPTPAGHFYIRELLHGLGSPAYGPWAFGTSAYSKLSDWPNGGVVGIHGTNEPRLIPGNPSHGCVRLKNRHIRKLKRLLPIGTPLLIL